MLVLFLVACSGTPGHGATAFDACMGWTQVACDCGNTEADAADPEWFCDADNAYGTCSPYDEAVCDTQDDAFDADACEAWHDIDTEAVREYYNCVAAAYADSCDETAGYDECGMNLPE